MKRSMFFAGAFLMGSAPAFAQQTQLPNTLTLPTPLVEHMAQQLQSMSAYMGGAAGREATATLGDLQEAANQQVKPAGVAAPTGPASAAIAAEHKAPVAPEPAAPPHK